MKYLVCKYWASDLFLRKDDNLFLQKSAIKNPNVSSELNVFFIPLDSFTWLPTFENGKK